jgi:hypothetical protein
VSRHYDEVEAALVDAMALRTAARALRHDADEFSEAFADAEAKMVDALADRWPLIEAIVDAAVEFVEGRSNPYALDALETAVWSYLARRFTGWWRFPSGVTSDDQ